MFQSQHRILLEYHWNFRRLPTYGFAYAKSNKWIFDPKILEVVDDIGIICNDFQSWFNSTIKISVTLILVKNLKIPGIQPIGYKYGFDP